MGSRICESTVERQIQRVQGLQLRVAWLLSHNARCFSPIYANRKNTRNTEAINKKGVKRISAVDFKVIDSKVLS